jgi:hypothetical protein
MTIQQWQALLTQINVIESRKKAHYEISLEEDLLAFESEVGFPLPTEYKEFLQVFGPGSFGGGFLDVYYPDLEFSREALGYLLDAGKEGFMKDALSWVAGEVYVTSEEAEEARKLLNSAFVFGRSSRQETLFWDLRTYSETDQSYDIYIARLDRIPVRICRSFYEFVHDICFGLNPQAVFPLQLQPYLNEISLIFRRSSI